MSRVMFSPALLMGLAVVMSVAAPAAAQSTIAGVVRDATGNFEAVIWILVALAALMIPLALALNPSRLRGAGASRPT